MTLAQFTAFQVLEHAEAYIKRNYYLALGARSNPDSDSFMESFSLLYDAKKRLMLDAGFDTVTFSCPSYMICGLPEAINLAKDLRSAKRRAAKAAKEAA